jgi:hypothetical protein
MIEPLDQRAGGTDPAFWDMLRGELQAARSMA